MVKEKEGQEQEINCGKSKWEKTGLRKKWRGKKGSEKEDHIDVSEDMTYDKAASRSQSN